jgi:hypothetical protein
VPTIAEVAGQIIAADLPVIFLDSCILLDVIRAIKRRYTNHVEQAVRLVAFATAAPRKCMVAISHIVQHEWNENELNLRDEATRHLREMQEYSGHFHDACDALNIARPFGKAAYSALSVADRLHDLSRQLRDCSVIIDHDDACSGRAMQRVMRNIPPSRQGGEAKDCGIIEECLAVSRQLHRAGFGRKRVFCTSNVNDYCERPPQLHAQLATDFADVGLRFTGNLSWGVHDLTH